MKTIYIILIIIFVVLTIFSLYGWIWHEDFQDKPITITPELQEKYKKFKAFYDPFMINWTKAVATSYTSRLPAPEPSPTPAPVKSPSNDELNGHVKELIQEMSKPLPYVTGPLPNTLTKQEVSQLVKMGTINPTPFLNALTWMNNSMDASHAALDQALKGAHTEGFEDICHQITQCTKLQEERERKEQEEKEAHVGDMMDSVSQNKAIQAAFERNKKLSAKSKEIQDKAQSGELLNQFIAPDSGESDLKFTAPAGSNLWKQMKKDHPDKAKDIQDNMKALVGVKEWADSINAGH